MKLERTDFGVILHDVVVGGRRRSIVLEPSVRPPFFDDDDQLIEWLKAQGELAVSRDEMGDVKDLIVFPPAFEPVFWVYRTLHNNGDVSIKAAPGNS